jgi:outer membrane receptor protein involved in Fe transport
MRTDRLDFGLLSVDSIPPNSLRFSPEVGAVVVGPPPIAVPSGREGSAMMLAPTNTAGPAGARSRGIHLGILSAVLVSSIWAPGPAQAQTGNSVVQGGIVDAVTRQPVTEAIVTVTSPSLQGEQTVLTDSSGFYRAPSLPPGVYTVRVDKDGYDSFEQRNVSIRSDVTFRVNVFLIPRRVEGKAEEIEITERPPTIDVGSSSLSTTISEDMIRRLPLARPDVARGGGVRSYEAVAAAAPQARGDRYGTSIAGSTSPENRYLINGLSVNDSAYGINTTPLSVEFLKEVGVVTGGYLPEYGRATGGIINATVKTGSNEIRGAAWTNITPGALEGTPKPVFAEGSTIYAGNPEINIIGDIGTDVGLPIIKDRLWLYLGVLGSTTRHDLPRALYATQVDAAGMPIKDASGATQRTLIPGTEQTYNAVSNSLQAVANLTFSPSRNHSLMFTSYVTPWRSGGDGNFGYDIQDGNPDGGTLAGTKDALTGVYRNDQFSNALKWTATTPGKRVTVETAAGWLHSSDATLPIDGSLPGSGEGLAGRLGSIRYRRTMPHPITDFESVPTGYCEDKGHPNAVRCPVTTYATGPGFISTRDQDRLQMASRVTLLAQALGHHVIKFGVDVERVSNDLTKAYPGGILFRENTAGTAFADYRNYGYLVGPDDAVYAQAVRAQVTQWGIGAFLQNSWSIADKVTLNAGIRYDSEYLYNNEGDLRMALPNQIAPRIGLIYDPTQAGRSKLFASFARYYQHVPLDVADRSLSAEPGFQGLHDTNICDPRDPNKTAACLERRSYRAIGNSYDPDQYYIPTGGGTTPIDPDLKTPTIDEYILGAEYQLLPESRLSLTFERRRLKDMIEDMSVDEAATYFIGNPGQGIAANFPGAVRDFDAMTLVFQKDFSQNWVMLASYRLSRLEGNIAGLYRPETGQLDPNINSDFDLLTLLPNRTGPLGSDNRHQLRLGGAYDFGFGRHRLNLGANLRATSGAPTSYLGSHGLYGPGEVFVLPRGSGPRLPWSYSSDITIRYGLGFANGHLLEAYGSVYNLFNLQGVTARDQTYTRADVLPISGATTTADLPMLRTQDGMPFDPMDVNPNFGRITAYQAPRVVTMGLRYNY